MAIPLELSQFAKVVEYNSTGTGGSKIGVGINTNHTSFAIGIGTTNPTATLDVNGPIRIIGGTFDAGQETRTDVAISINVNDAIYTKHGDGPSAGYLRTLIENSGGDINIGQTGTNLISSVNLYPGNSGSTNLYHGAANKKLQTTTSGIEVTGSVTATNFTGNLYSTGISTISGFTFPASDGTSGQVLGTDGAGQLAFITASSAGSGTTITNLHWTVGVGSTAFQSPHDIEDRTALVFNNGLKLSLDEDYYIESNTVYIKNGPLDEGDRVHVTIHYDTFYESEFFTATDGQTTFNLAATLLSSQDRAKVYLNGAKLRGTIDYGISQTVNLNIGATEGDLINISADAGESYTSASSGQTAFTYTSSGITASNLIVYQNGIRLEPTDYTVGSLSLVLTQGTEAGDSLDVLLYA